MEINLKPKYKISMDVAFMLIIAALTAFSIWKAPYGHVTSDEAFYLAVPYRLLQGDALLAQEWHVSQLSGLLLTPVLWLYYLLGGTSEGIILAFRYIYIAVQTLTAIYIYLSFRKDEDRATINAIAAACVYLMFVPYNIMALSYNTMGICALTIAGVSIATANNKWHKVVIGGGVHWPSLCCVARTSRCCMWYIPLRR